MWTAPYHLSGRHQVVTKDQTSLFQIEITTIASNYHIEVNPSDCGIYDRVVIQVKAKEVLIGFDNSVF